MPNKIHHNLLPPSQKPIGITISAFFWSSSTNSRQTCASIPISSAAPYLHEPRRDCAHANQRHTHAPVVPTCGTTPSNPGHRSAHDECPAAVRLGLLRGHWMFAGPSHAPRAHLKHLASPLATAYVCVRRAFARWLFLDRAMVNCRVGHRALETRLQARPARSSTTHTQSVCSHARSLRQRCVRVLVLPSAVLLFALTSARQPKTPPKLKRAWCVCACVRCCECGLVRFARVWFAQTHRPVCHQTGVWLSS